MANRVTAPQYGVPIWGTIWGTSPGGRCEIAPQVKHSAGDSCCTILVHTPGYTPNMALYLTPLGTLLRALPNGLEGHIGVLGLMGCMEGVPMVSGGTPYWGSTPPYI